MNDTTNAGPPPPVDGDDDALGDDDEASPEGGGAGSDDVDSATLRKRFRAFLEPHVRARPRDEQEAPPPSSVGGYEIGEFLGQGAMGRVYAAKQRATGRRVAIKFARAGTSHAARLEREARALGSIEHRHVAEVVAFGTDAGWAFLATRLVEGCTLADWIAERKGRPRSPEEVRTVLLWFRDLARALQASHGAGFVHLDVKPANVMIGVAGAGGRSEAILVDYGLSTRAGARTTALALGGTVPYMSPEQTLARPETVDGRSDVYSLAATFFEALTGVRAVDFDARHETVESLRRKVALEPTPAVSKAAPDLGAQFDALFAHAMRKSPDQRYASAADLADDVERVLAGRAPARVKEPLRVSAWRRRRPIAALALVAAAAFGWRASGATARENDAARRAIDAAEEDARRRSDPEAAVAFLDRVEDARFADDDVRRAARRVVATHGSAVSAAMLRDQTFVARGFIEDTPNAVRGRRAARLLPLVGNDDELLFQAAFDRLIRGMADDASKFALAAESRGSARFRTVVAVAASGIDGGRSLNALLSDPVPEGSSIADLALRAFGALYAFDRGYATDGRTLDAHFAALGAAAAKAPDAAPDELRFVRALRARHAECRDRPEEALAIARSALYEDVPAERRVGVAAQCAVFALRAAARPAAESRAAARAEACELVQVALSFAGDDAAKRGAVAEMIAAHVDDPEGAAGELLVDGVLKSTPKGFRARFGPQFLYACASSAQSTFDRALENGAQASVAADRLQTLWRRLLERTAGIGVEREESPGRREAAAYLSAVAFQCAKASLWAASSPSSSSGAESRRARARGALVELRAILAESAPDAAFAAGFAAVLNAGVEALARDDAPSAKAADASLKALLPAATLNIERSLCEELRELLDDS